MKKKKKKKILECRLLQILFGALRLKIVILCLNRTVINSEMPCQMVADNILFFFCLNYLQRKLDLTFHLMKSPENVKPNFL